MALAILFQVFSHLVRVLAKEETKAHHTIRSWPCNGRKNK